MRNKRINLFFGKKDYQDIQKYFRIFRFTLLVLSAVLCIFVLTFGYITFVQSNKIKEKKTEKKNNLQLFNSQKEQEVKLIKISNKVKDLENFSRDDAEFYPYYNKLVAILNESEKVPIIDSLLIEKDRNFSFSISFLNKESLIKTFQFIESEDFLKYFESILLKDISTQKSETEESHTMTFEGKFKKINENQD
jgi:hypothetical protein